MSHNDDRMALTRRTDRLVVRELETETVVYDLDTDQVHHLDTTAAAVWAEVEGAPSISALAAAVDADVDVVAAAVESLLELGLVAEVESGLTRRSLMKRGAIVGGAVIAMPTITSVLAPTAAAASSAKPPLPGEGSDNPSNDFRKSDTQPLNSESGGKWKMGYAPAGPLTTSPNPDRPKYFNKGTVKCWAGADPYPGGVRTASARGAHAVAVGLPTLPGARAWTGYIDGFPDSVFFYPAHTATLNESATLTYVAPATGLLSGVFQFTDADSGDKTNLRNDGVVASIWTRVSPTAPVLPVLPAAPVYTGALGKVRAQGPLALPVVAGQEIIFKVDAPVLRDTDARRDITRLRLALSVTPAGA